MASILFVCHSPSDNTRALRRAAIRGLNSEGHTVDVRDSLDADAAAVIGSDGVVIGTTENFGSIAGLTKDFFERIYYPCLEHTEATPFVAYVRAGQDGQGSLLTLERITTGLRWRAVQTTVLLQGEYDAEFERDVEDLTKTFAAGLSLGIF